MSPLTCSIMSMRPTHKKSSTLRFMIHCLHLIMERSFPHLQQAIEFTGEDDLDLVITLRDDVTFSNGDPLTADDVLFTMQMN